MSGLMILLIVILIAALMMVFYYNGFIAKRNRADQAFSTIDVMLKRRCDLVPNLVAVVKEYASHEREVLEKITALRSRAVESGDADERLRANNELGHQLHGLMIQMERYPELKANTNFLHLQHSLNEVEEQLAAARRTFNASVTDYNTAIQMFPGTLLAGWFHFAPRPLLEIDARERETPEVGKLFNS